MEKYYAAPNVKYTGVNNQPPACTRLTSDALPEARKSIMTNSSNTGKPIHSMPQPKENETHWHAMRANYGRERKVYDFPVTHGLKAYLHLSKPVKMVDDKRTTVEESRIPNIFFARGTEDELKTFVYDNVNLPFLRFYYRHMSVGRQTVNVPIVVPDSQMNNLKIICAADNNDIVVTPEAIERFKEGQQVRITEGKFAGVTGIVARYQSQQRVGIIIEGLLTICTAYVPSAFLDVV